MINCELYDNYFMNKEFLYNNITSNSSQKEKEN